MGDVFTTRDENDGEPTVVGPPRGSGAHEPSRDAFGPERVDGDVVGRYVVTGRLGAGAMGVVLRAYDPKLRREVALKLVRKDLAGGSEGRARLLREAQALARLNHPNIVTIFDAEDDAQGVCIAMEYVQGATLREWTRERPRRWQEVVELVLAAARGLTAAHRAGLVHRDVKPDNVLVGLDGRVRVTDFGLARGSEAAPHTDAGESGLVDDSDTATKLGTVMGTPSYMAPEQHEGAVADDRCDQYGLCVTLWEALHGARPFSGRTLDDLKRAKRAGPPARPPGVIPRWLHAAIARGLAPEPNDRWPSVAALAQALASGRARAGRRRLGWSLAALGVMGCATLGWRHHDRSRKLASCHDAGAQIESLWNADTKADLRRALVSTGVHFADLTHDKLVPWIDRWSASWSELRTELCTSRELGRAQPDEEHAAAIACLSEHKDALAGLLEVLSEPDPTTVQRAVPAAAGLPSLAECTDPGVLRRRPPPPTGETAQQVAELRRELMRVAGLEAAGRYQEAYERADALLEAARMLGDVPLVAACRLRVAGLADRAGDLVRAEQVLADTFAEAGKRGLDELAAEASATLVHVIGIEAARHDEGLAWADAATMLLRRSGKDGSYDEARLASRIAMLHWSRAAHDEALPLAQRALAIRERVLGPEHPEVGRALANLATIQEARGRYDSARTLQERSLRIYEAALGPEHPRLAPGLNNLADLLVTLGELDEARALLERSIAIDEAALGSEHPDLAHAEHNLGRVHAMRGALDEARAHFQRAIDLREKGLGNDHPLLATSLTGLGSIDFALGDLDAAEASFTRALAIEQTVYGPDHAHVSYGLNNLGAVKSNRGERDEAVRLYRRAIEIRAGALGSEHPELVLLLDNLGRLLIALDELDEAREVFERALEIARASYRPDHPDIAAALGGLGAALAAAGRLAESDELQHRALAILEATHGPEHHQLVLPLLALGENALARGAPEEAIALLERVLAVHDTTIAEHRPPAATYFALARALWDAPRDAGGDRQRARELALDAIAYWRTRPGDAKELAEAESWLASRSR